MIIAFKIMFLDCVIFSKAVLVIQLPPSSLAKNIILNTIAWRNGQDPWGTTDCPGLINVKFSAVAGKGLFLTSAALFLNL
jgi:hypothetical protein